ncbi:unnamed protein product [Lactuca virosa]|uniref:Protein kinase domain-containing protein n=1 Tax=Lactuca virosa TaxID=75947 RepID=A0AAU9NR01_9ASTR|nr:unnamed protein product [Lactuca virosa]
MSSPKVNLEEYLIPLEEILMATRNFNPNNLIGRSDLFGDFYIGQFSERWQNRTLAIRRKYFGAFKGLPDFGTTEIAYQCISWNLKDRPTMKTVIKKIQEALNIQNPGASRTITQPRYQHETLESFLIPLEEILSATQNFSEESYIGGDRSGKVYIGELWQKRKAAFKRLKKNSYRAEDDFNNKLRMVPVSTMKTSLVSLHLHEPETNGRHCLTWKQRLKICVGAARGLEYFHSGLEEDNKVIHRDINCSNILLDDDHKAKISDFSLSLIVDRNLPETYDRVARTSYYTYPIYYESGLPNTKSDVYSFGAVLLEMVSGMKVNHRRSIGTDDGP